MPDNPLELDAHNLARISILPASKAVGGEATDFTPWLAEHINELGEAIGVELSLGSESAELVDRIRANTEVPVGQFFLDIRAEAVDGRIAAIENQYGKSDHKHLGQVLTYSAGVGADIVVWVAEDFTDPHLETLRWMNKRTDEAFGVYAVRIRFIRIGDSPAAPQFEVVVAPSATARAERKVTASTDHWTRDSFLKAIAAEAERQAVEKILDSMLATNDDALWFGLKPRGQINLHPYGLHEGPSAISVTDGEVHVRGLWTFWKATYRHEAFAPLAKLLGQDIEGPARWVPLRSIEADRFIELNLTISQELRGAHSTEVGHRPMAVLLGCDSPLAERRHQNGER